MSERVLQGHHLDTNFKSKELLRFPNDLYTQLKKDFSRNQVNLMRQAYTFASNAHDGQERMDGKPYISHPLEVARILVEMNMDVDSICAGLMHDVLEDCNIEKRNIDKIFGKDVSEIVDGVSKIGKLDFQSKAERDINSFQKMALAMAKDVRVIVVKLADRLHNMRTIDFLPRNKQIRVAKETLEIYGPIALRIGMQKVRAELEDLAFDCLHPLRAEMLRSAIKKSMDFFIADLSISALRGCKQSNAKSSSSARTFCIPIRSAIGPYISRVSFATLICLFLGRKSIVRMLCNLSASLTTITRTSFAMARAIFWKLFISLSALDWKSSFPILLTPSTISDTSLPKILSIFLFSILQSSRTSCIRPAQIESTSIFISTNILATSNGWLIYGLPSILSWPS